jgi:pyruvate/2-oxoglutarate/acetoin dehydrogenase E1 component
LVFLHKAMFNVRGPVPEEEYLIPLGEAAVVREGTDVTLIATLKMVQMAQEAAEAVAQEGVSVEIIDPRTLVPLDKKTILDSIRKTNRVVVLDEAFGPYGVGAEIAALAADEAFYHLDAPIKRIHPLSVPEPSSPPLEQAIVPKLEQVTGALREVMNQ